MKKRKTIKEKVQPEITFESLYKSKSKEIEEKYKKILPELDEKQRRIMVANDVMNPELVKECWW